MSSDQDSMHEFMAHMTQLISQSQISWKMVGLSDEAMAQRTATLWERITAVMDEFHAEQDVEQAEYEAKLDALVAEIMAVKERLGDTSGNVEPVGEDLITRTRSLMPKREELKAEEARRLSVLTALKERIYDASTRLGVDVPAQFSTLDGPLSESRTATFTDHVHKLEVEQQNRRSRQAPVTVRRAAPQHV